MSDEFERRLETLRRYSRFCAEWLEGHEARFDELRKAGALDRPPAIEGAPAAEAESAEVFMRELRCWRNEWMFVIAWRELVGQAPLEEVLGAVSDLADAAVEAALGFAERELGERYGAVREEGGGPRRLIARHGKEIPSQRAGVCVGGKCPR